LAEEIFNSYEAVYPDARQIVSCFNKQPSILPAAQIDEFAQRTKKQWAGVPYDRLLFRRLVVEIGLLGAIVSETDLFVEGEFEYMTEGTLNLSDTESCVIHPVFYRYLRVVTKELKTVYPLTTAHLQELKS